ncbi:hypothetical protein [Pseudomonas koreensis]|uniref:hypothetical protein n=1 Tax=Pseudomonas koreensis TaxID=198620 RepID=UPI001FF0D835|nr:hypothetical protein [Pseudomonas koreensis]
MTDLSHAKIGDIVEDASEFFAPVSADLVDGLIGGYLSERGRIEQLHEMMTGEGFSSALWYFMEGNTSDQGRYYTTDVARLMQLEPAIATLNASYWGKALSLTDVYECSLKNAVQSGKNKSAIRWAKWRRLVDITMSHKTNGRCTRSRNSKRRRFVPP